VIKHEMVKEIRKFMRRSGHLAKLHAFPLDEGVLSKIIYDTFLKVLQTALLSGDDVKVRGLGTFRVSYQEPKTQTYNFTGEKIDVPPKIKLKFQPSRYLVRKLNEKLL